MAQLLIDTDKTEPDNLSVSISVLITLFLIGVSIVFCYFLFISFLSIEQNDKLTFLKTSKIDSLNQQSSIHLNSLKWLDQSRGIVKVPISLAKDIVIEQYNP